MIQSIACPKGETMLLGLITKQSSKQLKCFPERVAPNGDCFIESQKPFLLLLREWWGLGLVGGNVADRPLLFTQMDPGVCNKPTVAGLVTGIPSRSKLACICY